MDFSLTDEKSWRLTHDDDDNDYDYNYTYNNYNDADYGNSTLPDFIIRYPDCFALFVSGDEGMSEHIHDGDMIVILPENRPIFGKLYVVRIDGIPHLRRLIPEDGRLILKSPDGPIEDYRPATMELLGEVIGYVGKFDRTM